MKRSLRLGSSILSFVAVSVAIAGTMAGAGAAVVAESPAVAAEAPLHQVVAMRRLTETQYRNSIADIFGTQIKVSGRFEPIVRPAHHLIATATGAATISPTGLEQFDVIARNIAAQVFNEANRDRYVECAPRDAKAADGECARQVLAQMGRYLFRRPLTSAEQATFVKIANAGAAESNSFYEGMQLALAALLVSPDFLYVMESAEPDPGHPGELRLDNYSRAARLSFLLWDTTPNEALLQAAIQGRLTDQAGLDAIAASMIRSRRLEAGVRAFFSDMLVFERFNDLAKDAVVYPRFNAEVAAAMPEQTLRTIVDLLVTRDGDYRELFTTRRTYMTRVLGPLYGARVADTRGWTPYEFAPGDERAGILTQAGFLALGDAQTGRSSPTIRGRAIRELLLCEPVPDPPGNVNFTAVNETASTSLPTAKVRLSQHISNPVCAGCHRITDPIGLTLEQFDGIGAFRTRENDAPIDASAELDGAKVTGSRGLGEHLAVNPAITQCVAGRALEYATGRTLNDDEKILSAIHKSFQDAGYRLSALFLRIATMPEAYRVPSRPVISPPMTAVLSTFPRTSIGARR